MRPKITQIVIASKNIHKIRELKEMIGSIPGIDILSLLDFPSYIPPEETGKSFEDNATIKATHAAKSLKLFAIADDSGLVVPSLNGQPGILSARYAGNNATDSENRKKLLSNMEMLGDRDRSAYFKCCLAVASPKGLEKIVCATCEGYIIKTEKGGSGFGYDPIFIKNDYNKTFAELGSTVKNKISHRRKAVDKLKIYLESLQP